MISGDDDLTIVLLLIVSVGIIGPILLNATIGGLCGYFMPGISVLGSACRGVLAERGRVRLGTILFVAGNGEFAVCGVVVVSHTYSVGCCRDLPALPSAEQ